MRPNERSINNYIDGEGLMENIAEKKKAILESTLELIKENGFHGTPMSMVAKKAGVAAGTIYHYFDSKDTLIYELHSYVINTMLKAIIVGDDPQKPFEARFINLWYNNYNYYLHHPDVFQFLEQYANSPYQTHHFNESQCVTNTLRKIIGEGITQGVLKPIPERLIGELIHSSVAAVARLTVSKRLDVTNQVLQQAVQVIWDGLKSK